MVLRARRVGRIHRRRCDRGSALDRAHRETLGPNLPQYAWSGAYLIARHAGSLGVSKAEYFARFCALLIELIAMSRSPRSDRGRFRARGPSSLVRTTWSVSRSSFLGTLFGWRPAKTSSRPARQ